MGEAELYKLTYRQLVCLVQELQRTLKYLPCTYERHSELNHERTVNKLLFNQIKVLQDTIITLKFDLRKYSAMMVEDKQENVVKEYGIVDSNVVSNDEFMEYRRKRGGGRGSQEDWLTDMEWGTIFYVRQKPVTTGSRSWLLQKFIKAGNQKNVVLIIPMHANEEVITDEREWMPVEPKAFCRSFELVSEFEPIPLEEDE